MKKRVLRLVALCLTLILLCTALCGCGAIDDLRAANATKPDSDTVVWNGATYKRVDALQSEKIIVGGEDYDRSVYINTDDVPVLLLPMICSEYHPTENNVFLSRVNYIEWSADIGKPTDAGEYHASYYCREDRFDAVVRQLRDGLELTGYMYNYYDFKEGKQHTYHFTAEEIAAFESVVSPLYRWGTAKYDYDYSAMVYACTDDGLLDATQQYEILIDDGVYYVAFYPEVQSDYYWDDEATEYYRVPKELHDVFQRIMEKSMQEQTYWGDQEINIVESLDET